MVSVVGCRLSALCLLFSAGSNAGLARVQSANWTAWGHPVAVSRSVMQREAPAPTASVCQVVPAVLGEQIGDIAALCEAMGL